MSEPVLSFSEYQALVEQAPILVWRAGVDTKCDYFNERWLAFTGRTMAQELGNGWTEGVHPEDFDDCLKTYLGAFERREAFEMRYRLRRHDGCYRWIFDRGVPYFDSTGGFAGYIGSCIDVTETVEAEAALERARHAELKVLKGLLPICAWCKKVRDDRGYWEQVEVYVRDRTDAVFSHGICPTCAASLKKRPGQDRR
jgi:PAS domain S-box-containing protein